MSNQQVGDYWTFVLPSFSNMAVLQLGLQNDGKFHGLELLFIYVSFNVNGPQSKKMRRGLPLPVLRANQQAKQF
jgi:hypothetical protein